jgi:Arc/MetJ family transcription regulator
MRTNIELDDRLVEMAFRYAPVKTKKELVALALREYVEHHAREDLRALRGGDDIAPDYDYRPLRERVADE